MPHKKQKLSTLNSADYAAADASPTTLSIIKELNETFLNKVNPDIIQTLPRKESQISYVVDINSD